MSTPIVVTARLHLLELAVLLSSRGNISRSRLILTSKAPLTRSADRVTDEALEADLLVPPALHSAGDIHDIITVPPHRR
jgi:hypothetical protein